MCDATRWVVYGKVSICNQLLVMNGLGCGTLVAHCAPKNGSYPQQAKMIRPAETRAVIAL